MSFNLSESSFLNQLTLGTLQVSRYYDESRVTSSSGFANSGIQWAGQITESSEITRLYIKHFICHKTCRMIILPYTINYVGPMLPGPLIFYQEKPQVQT